MKTRNFMLIIFAQLNYALILDIRKDLAGANKITSDYNTEDIKG
jgi:hypothetical protein